MSDADAPKQEKLPPDALELRAKPRPVTRLSRPALIVIAGGAALVIGASMMIALRPSTVRDVDARRELYNVKTKPTAEGLASLPKDYGSIKPDLGAPLPGDLGASILNAERDLGIAPQQPFRPSPEDQAARNEAMRQAQMRISARESSVFFQLSRRADNKPATGAVKDVEKSAADPFRFLLDRTEKLEVGELQNGRDQQHQLAFLKGSADPSIYNAYALQDPVSSYQLLAGTIIPASLMTGINSDLPGVVIAQVTEHVYDTVLGIHLLVPQGARLIGKYDSVIAFGQERALVVWNRIIFPDGASIVIDNMPASDAAGYAGLADRVDFHTFRLLKGIALSTLLGVGTELSVSESESDLVEAFRGAAQSTANQAGQRIVDRVLEVQPTITVRPGAPVRIILNKDLILRAYEQ